MSGKQARRTTRNGCAAADRGGYNAGTNDGLEGAADVKDFFSARGRDVERSSSRHPYAGIERELARAAGGRIGEPG